MLHTLLFRQSPLCPLCFCLSDELLHVEEEHYAPLLPRAESLLKRHGPQVLAAVLALLSGKHRLPGLVENNRYDAARHHRDNDLLAVRSLLTGRKGYVAILVYDPAHTVRGLTKKRKRKEVFVFLTLHDRQSGLSATGSSDRM